MRVLTRAAFSWRRKQLGTILSRHPDLRIPRGIWSGVLASRSLSPTVRPEQLSPDEFVALSACWGKDPAADRPACVDAVRRGASFSL